MSIFGIAGGSRAFSSASGGKIYAYNGLTTVPSIPIPANPSRQKITFHNPGDTDVFVYQQYYINTGSNLQLAPTTGALGGTFRVFANGGTLVVDGECQMAWGIFAASGITACLTVMDSNIS